MREILKSRKCPGAKDDTSFFAGRGTLERQFHNDPTYLDKITDNAKKQGYTPNPNDVYFASLARFEGDRRAFISQAEGTAKIKKICEQEGLGCEGSISVRGRKTKGVKK